MAAVRRLQLKQELIRSPREPAADFPFATILVEQRFVHLNSEYEYVIPEGLSERAVVGALVEVEFGTTLTKGVILSRSEFATSSGVLKEVLDVLTRAPYVQPDQMQLIKRAAEIYGANPWDILRASTPPFSKIGERDAIAELKPLDSIPASRNDLPDSLRNFLGSKERFTCAIELPSSTPYWEIVAQIAIQRAQCGTVLVILPNERELELIDSSLLSRGQASLAIRASEGRSQRYKNYLLSRSINSGIILGLRSSCLLSLPIDAQSSTIILLDDVDESHYERQAPTWNSRELIQLRESDNSVIYASTSISLEIAERVIEEALPLYRFPPPVPLKFHSATPKREAGYFGLIGEGMKTGSVLISVGGKGYITSFSCQQCRNIALCNCGGKLYLPSRTSKPRCATCATEVIEWSCTWCHGSKPRAVQSGVERRAEEFGRSFPRHSVIHSSAENPVPLLPGGNHLVLSTPGVEPRGIYKAIIFLDLEGRLMRTTLRAGEDLRFHIFRTLSMLEVGGSTYLDLQPSDPFLQTILRANPLGAAERELESRRAANLLPSSLNIVISGETLDGAKMILENVGALEIVGPFLRNGKKSALIKASREMSGEIVSLLRAFNKVQSMRKEGLLTYQINPYSLN